MKPTENPPNEMNAYLFNVDLLVQGETNAQALSNLLQALNQCNFADYRIVSGVELGKLIGQLEARIAVKEKNVKEPASPDKQSAASANQQAALQSKQADSSSGKQTAAERKQSPASKSSVKHTAYDFTAAEGIRAIIRDNRLIRLTVNKGFGVKLNFPCRVINYDEATHIITVYHVDEKQVYAFNLNEIDDFVV